MDIAELLGQVWRGELLPTTQQLEALALEFGDDTGRIPIVERCELDITSDAVEVIISERFAEQAEEAEFGRIKTSYKVGTLPPKVLAEIRFPQAQMSDRPNRNRRIYPHEDMRNAVENVDRRARKGEVFILGGHPSFFDIPTFSDSAGLLRRANLDEDTGDVGIAVHLVEGKEGTAAFNHMLAGGSLPISSRAYGRMELVDEFTGKFGTYGKAKKENLEAEEAPKKKRQGRSNEGPFVLVRDFVFEAWDLVAGTQSVPGAIVRPRQRGAVTVRKDEALTADPPPQPTPERHSEDRIMDLKELREKHPTAARQLEESVEYLTERKHEATTKELRAKNEKLEAEVRELSTEKGELKAKVEKTEGELSAAVKERDELSEKVKAADEKVADLEKEKGELTEKVAELNEELNPEEVPEKYRAQLEELAELKRQGVVAKVKELATGGKYSAFAEHIIEGLSGDNMPADVEAAQKAVEAAEARIHNILVTARDKSFAVTGGAKEVPENAEDGEDKPAEAETARTDDKEIPEGSGMDADDSWLASVGAL